MKFQIFQDPDYGYVVADASIGAHSFAMVPRDYEFSFQTLGGATEQADKLERLGEVEMQWLETPDRFEAVADTLYGAPWGE